MRLLTVSKRRGEEAKELGLISKLFRLLILKLKAV
jgi:hypothetical protein